MYLKLNLYQIKLLIPLTLKPLLPSAFPIPVNTHSRKLSELKPSDMSLISDFLTPHTTSCCLSLELIKH